MSKRIDIDGKSYRMRRGVMVEIPAEWVGKIPTAQTIRKRPSKQTNKQARELARWRYGRVSPGYHAARNEHCE